jgi:predicted Zn-dependent protease with MMP-like domain
VIIQGLTLAAIGFALLTLAYLIRSLGRFTMSVQSAVDAITTQLVKAQGEIVSRIADVQAQLDNAGVAEQIDLSSLAAAAQALDDVVADVAVVAEEVVVDEPVVDEPTVDPAA